LNLFAQHAGEIGRSHEVFLRSILSRFLPSKLRCGTGFVASRDDVSHQQDIIIFDPQTLPLLFEVGDCLVCDAEAVAATIEVKTDLASSSDFGHAISQLRKKGGHHFGFKGLYAWDGLALDSAIDCYWKVFEEQGRIDTGWLPSAVYVRERYLILPNYDGRLDTAPLRVLELGAEHHPEGWGLLSLVEYLWTDGLGHHARRPWWVDEWRRKTAERFQLIDWPDRLRPKMLDELARRINANKL
jgi:hypothetical protein